MEEDLDRIAGGDEQRAALAAALLLRRRGRASTPRRRLPNIGRSGQGLKHLVEDLGEIDARAISTIDIGEGIVVRVGRYGPYVEETVPQGVDLSTGEMTDDAADPTPRRATINDDIAPDEMTPAKARELLDAVRRRRQVLGQDPVTGRDIVAKAGRYGPYVTEVLARDRDRGARRRGKAKVKPRTASPVQGHGPRDHGPRHRAASCSACRGSSGLSTEEDGTPVEITAQNGRYGPYLKKGTDSRSLTTEQQLFDITLDEALAIYAQPKQRGRASARAAQGARQRPGVGQGRWWSRTVASGPTSPTARPTRPCARATTPSRSRPSAAPSCSPRSGPRARPPASGPRRRRPRRPPRRRRPRRRPPRSRPRRKKA